MPGLYCHIGTLKCEDQPELWESCGGVKTCKSPYKCGDDFKCHKNPRRKYNIQHACKMFLLDEDFSLLSYNQRLEMDVVLDSPVLLVRILRRRTSDSWFLLCSKHSCYFPSTLGLKCKNLGFMNKCIPDGEDKALAKTLNEYKDDDDLNKMLAPFQSDAQGIVDETLAMMRSSGSNGLELSESVMGNCASSVSGQSAQNVESCFGSSVNAAGDDLNTLSSQKENYKTKLLEIKNSFMSHLRAYHTEAYDKAGMSLPEDFEETLGVGYPGHLQIGVAVSGCALYGIHGMAGLSLDYNNDDVGWYAGGGYIAGVCAGAGVDVEIARVFSSNTLDDGGVSSGGSFGGDYGPGVDLFFDIDHDDGNEPSFAIGMAAGYGVGVDLSYVLTYEAGGCFGRCNKYGVDLCGEGRKSMQGSCIKDFDVRGVSPSCNMQEYDVNLMSVP
eukprot:scaffold350653_cov142-Cyclotella_meneghiniana.AAC.1